MPQRYGRCDDCPPCVECTPREDSFDRANADNLGSEWDAPDFSISGNKATVEDPDEDQLAIFETGTGDGHEGQRVECDIQSGAEGDKIGVIFAVTDDSNYYRAYVELANGEDNATIYLERIQPGPFTFLRTNNVTAEPGQTYRLSVCVSGSALHVALDGEVAINVPFGSLPAFKAGLYNGGVNTNPTWDNYYQRGVLTDSEVCPPCTRCGCLAEDVDEIDELVLVIEDVDSPAFPLGFPYPGDFCLDGTPDCADLYERTLHITQEDRIEGSCAWLAGFDFDEGDCCDQVSVEVQFGYHEKVTISAGPPFATDSVDPSNKCFIYVRIASYSAAGFQCMKANYYAEVEPGWDLFAAPITLDRVTDPSLCVMPETITIQGVAA